MTCLREKAAAERRGVVHCTEEGCQFARVSFRSGPETVGYAPAGHCVLQPPKSEGQQFIETDAYREMRAQNLEEYKREMSDPKRRITREDQPVTEISKDEFKQIIKERFGYELSDWHWKWLKNRNSRKVKE